MLHRVPLVRTDVSEEYITAIIRVTRIGELGITLAVTGNRSTLRPSVASFGCVLQLLVTANVIPSSLIIFTLMIEAIYSSETSVLTGATRRNIAEDAIPHSHRRENLKSYIIRIDSNRITVTSIQNRHNNRLQDEIYIQYLPNT
jgi:hypothetical protein